MTIVLPVGYRGLYHGKVVSSTNDVAREYARGSRLYDRSLVYADTQTGGRGTKGRAWQSYPGNIHASLILQSCLDDRLPLLMVVAILKALKVFTHCAVSVCYKWPNDILLDHQKVSGILSEGLYSGSDHAHTIIIGFGVNIITAPSGFSHVQQHAHQLLTSAQCLQSIVAHFEKQRIHFMRHGFSATQGFLTRSLQSVNSSNIKRQSIDRSGHLIYETKKNQTFSRLFSWHDLHN